MIYGVDTQALSTKREKGSLLAGVLARGTQGCPNGPLSPPTTPAAEAWRENYIDGPFYDPDQQNLVAGVSISSANIPTYLKTVTTSFRMNVAKMSG